MLQKEACGSNECFKTASAKLNKGSGGRVQRISSAGSNPSTEASDMNRMRRRSYNMPERKENHMSLSNFASYAWLEPETTA